MRSVMLKVPTNIFILDWDKDSQNCWRGASYQHFLVGIIFLNLKISVFLLAEVCSPREKKAFLLPTKISVFQSDNCSIGQVR